MTDEFNAALRRAGKLVRAGNPKAATEAIQNALGTGGLGSMAKAGKSPFENPRSAAAYARRFRGWRNQP